MRRWLVPAGRVVVAVPPVKSASLVQARPSLEDSRIPFLSLSPFLPAREGEGREQSPLSGLR